MGWSLLAPVADDGTGALDNLAGLAFRVDLAETSPLTKLHVGIDLDKRNVMLHTESSDKLLIAGLITILAQDAQQSLTLVKSLSALAKTTAQAIGNKSLLEKLVTALCMEHNIPLIKVDSNMKLGEWAGLCKIDPEGKARKVVKCSCAVISNWGKETPAHDVLKEYLKSQK
jgi:hypothetical protein